MTRETPIRFLTRTGRSRAWRIALTALFVLGVAGETLGVHGCRHEGLRGPWDGGPTTADAASHHHPDTVPEGASDPDDAPCCCVGPCACGIRSEIPTVTWSATPPHSEAIVARVLPRAEGFPQDDAHLLPPATGPPHTS